MLLLNQRSILCFEWRHRSTPLRSHTIKPSPIPTSKITPSRNPLPRIHSLSPRAITNSEVSVADEVMIGTRVNVLIITSDSTSPFGPSWLEVMEHIGRRLQWTNPRFNPTITTLDRLLDPQSPDLVLLVGVTDLQCCQKALYKLQPLVIVAMDCPDEFNSLNSFKGFNPEAPSLWDQLQLNLPWKTTQQQNQRIYDSIQDLWNRRSSDDIVYTIQLLTNQFITDLEEMSDLDPDFDSLKCIARNCGKQVLNCLLDPECRKALDCLNSCGINDQVCSYRCIVSYESRLLEEFSLCILQRHNCLGRSASIPTLPEVLPMESYQGEALTFEKAEEIFIGHHERLPWSWKVAYGKNPAYDYFPCQFQVFYRGKGKNSMWYDPVFKVIKIDGDAVWRRRHYKVRRAKIPGTFHFSVLDNGVTSNEFWRIVDADEELKWALFYYSGAAAAAGISYSGAVLGTQDGNPPSPSQQSRISQALERCGIKEWELSAVDYTCCENPPL